jgi:hypothetical protein
MVELGGDEVAGKYKALSERASEDFERRWSG